MKRIVEIAPGQPDRTTIDLIRRLVLALRSADRPAEGRLRRELQGRGVYLIEAASMERRAAR